MANDAATMSSAISAQVYEVREKRSAGSSRANSLSLASRFAALLDRDQFAAARHLMAPRCSYRFRGGTVVGADKIVDMYRTNSVKGRRVLDELRFESKVEGVRGGSVSILYIDYLRKGRHTHAHRCRQFLRISKGKIVAIRHSDLRGEAKALRAFFKAGRASHGDEKRAKRLGSPPTQRQTRL
jgi:hypothetical protein